MLVALPGLLIGLSLGALIGALFLRLACRICHVDPPPLRRASLIVAAAIAADLLAALLIGLATAATSHAPTQAGQQALTVINTGLSLLASIPLTAWIYSRMLPASLGQGLLILLAQSAILSGVIVAAAALVFGLLAILG